MKCVLGIDIGGTSVKFAPVFEDGSLGQTRKIAVGKKQRSELGMTELISDIVNSAQKEFGKQFVGVGIGIPGVVLQPDGVVRQSPHFPEWRDFAIAKQVSISTGVKNITVENDVNAAAVGEFWLGAARGEQNFLLIFIGTGLGGAVFLGGRLWRGVKGMAGEIGHVNLIPNGRQCNCGARGCLETYVSQVGLYTTVKEHKDKNFVQMFEGLQRSEYPSKLYELATSGNKTAKQIFEDAGWKLGVVLGSLLNVLDVELIVVGGGVGKALPMFENKLLESIRSHSFKAIGERVNVVAAKLGDNAGIVGAAALALGKRGILIA